MKIQNYFFYIFIAFLLIIFFCLFNSNLLKKVSIAWIFKSSSGFTSSFSLMPLIISSYLSILFDISELSDELAANLLASVTKKCKDLVAYMKEKYPNDKRVKQLVNGFNPKKISETLPTSTLTAYSENKGEKIAFCLNKTKDGDKLIDLNTLTFVAIHELAHIMTTSVGHKQEFWQNFKFLLVNAKDANIYQPIDYKKNPKQYCGMDITDNPYFDLK